MTIDSYLRGKNILVFGLGRQGGGVGDTKFLASHDYSVRATDMLDKSSLGLLDNEFPTSVKLSLGTHNKEDIQWADIILKNPGVPDEHPLIAYAKSLNKEVVSSIALFVKYAPIPTIGITGTRGKSTTTALISAMLQKAYPAQIITGGNIPGTSGLSLFDELSGKKYAVLELSSFQLHSLHDLRVSPSISIITNLYPDHLNRYLSMAEYQYDKEAIVAYQSNNNYALTNSQNPGSLAIASKSKGKIIKFDPSSVAGWPTSLPGIHNQENIAAMAALAQLLEIPANIPMETLQSFPGLPFRQEKVATINGISYINDTTATTPVAAEKALAAQKAPFILICGGDTKSLPYEDFVSALTKNNLVKNVVILGSKNIPGFVSSLHHAIPGKIAGQVFTMKEAVELATVSAKSGDTILLSPGFASFDLFSNEFDRGRQFNECVDELKNNSLSK